MEGPTLLVLAAGLGSRYGSLKQMASMGPDGETILDYSLYDAICSGFRRVVFVIREEFEEAFRTKVGERFKDLIEVGYAFQRLEDIPVGFEVPADRTKPWGTAHAVYAARHEISGSFAAINADDFYGRDAYAQVAGFLADPASDSHLPYCLVGYRLGTTLSEHGGVNRGVTSHEQEFLRDVEEISGISRHGDGRILGYAADGSARELMESDLVSMNFWGFTSELFSQLEGKFRGFLESRNDLVTAEWHIPAVVDTLLKTKEATCHVIPTSGTWFGVTHLKDTEPAVERIRGLIAAGEYPSPLG